jgi:uncharacterized protein (DUF1697 family)
MIKYFALLRGINVSGKKIIKMDYLKLIFESIGYQNVKTYIQSGNVIFDSPDTDQNLLCEKIKNYLLERLGYKVIVFLRSLDELKNIIKNNPFISNLKQQNANMYVVFLMEEPTDASKQSLISRNNDIEVFEIKDREIYCLRLKKYDGKTRFTLYSIEKILGMPATTRNWSTINKLISI